MEQPGRTSMFLSSTMSSSLVSTPLTITYCSPSTLLTTDGENKTGGKKNGTNGSKLEA